ncbi:MAG: glycerate kinase, partial [Chthoniobacterales bacterium]
REITSVAELQSLARIARPSELALPPITAVSDVRNPLLGARGATQTFGPQKGARPEQLEILERALARMADVIAQEGRDFGDAPGAGAAGGLGFGLLAFCGAQLRPGFEVVAEAINLRDEIAWADYVITGEGKLDRQTLEGKAPAGVARMARELSKPVFAIVGQFSGEEEVRALFDGIYPLDNEPPQFPQTAELLAQRARELAVAWDV